MSQSTPTKRKLQRQLPEDPPATLPSGLAGAIAAWQPTIPQQYGDGDCVIFMTGSDVELQLPTLLPPPMP